MGLVVWETGLGKPLVIEMSEDAIGQGTVNATISSGGSGETGGAGDAGASTAPTLLGLYVPTKPDWLTVTGEGSAALSLSVDLTDSPFSYRVDSVGQDRTYHSTASFAQVPCSKRIFNYERLDNGIKDELITVEARFSDGSIEVEEFTVQIHANYSIGRDLLQGVIQCQA